MSKSTLAGQPFATNFSTAGRLVSYAPSADAILALENQLTTAYNDKFNPVEQTYQKIATVLPMDEKGLVFGWLSSDDDLELFDPVQGRVVRQLAAHGARIEVQKYTKTIGVSFDDIRDGKFTAAVLTAAGIGRSTTRHPDRLVYGVLKNNGICYDNTPLFGTHKVNMDNTAANAPTFTNEDMSGDPTNPVWYLAVPAQSPVLFGVRSGEDYSFGVLGDGSDNAFMKEQILFGVRARVVAAGGLPQFIYRSNRPLTAANLEAAVTAMNAIVGPEGQPISNYPTHLIVPKTLRAAAKRLMDSDRNADNAGYNEWYGAFETVVSDYL